MTATPFNPMYGGNIRVTVLGTPTEASITPGTGSLRIVHEGVGGSAIVAVKIFASTDVGTTPVSAKDIIVLPATSVIVKKPIDADRVQYTQLVGTGTAPLINIQPGEGGVL